VPLLIIEDLSKRKLPHTATRNCCRVCALRTPSTLPTSNRPVEDLGNLFGDSAPGFAMLDRLLRHGHALKCGPRSWRAKTSRPGESQ
jgi:hypothetical protein